MNDQAERKRPDFIERLERKRDEHVNRGIFYRIVFAVTGVIVLLAGLAMTVLPGPALVVIPIGLAMLALEFAWAEKMLELALERAEIAKEKVADTTRTQKIFGFVAMALGTAAFIAAAISWDIPLLPV
jgi:tellurite resistance protein TerC